MANNTKAISWKITDTFKSRNLKCWDVLTSWRFLSFRSSHLQTYYVSGTAVAECEKLQVRWQQGVFTEEKGPLQISPSLLLPDLKL